MGRLSILISTAKRILTNWDYSNLDDVFTGDGVVDFKAMIVKIVVVCVHLVIVATLPLSTPIVVYVGRVVEIRDLKSWVSTMRNDRGFFSQHHYVEIKRHIDQHKDSYHLTLNW